MRFKEFLEGVTARQQKPGVLSLEQMVEWVENNASGFISNNCPAIYRGVDTGDNAEGLYNGAVLNRKAANTLNYANLWLSNANEWSKYPTRSKSFICTTNERYAESYGTTYRIIPSDNSMIGICPAEDLWESFPKLKKLGSGMSLKHFMGFTDEMTRMYGGKGGMEDDWDIFAAHLNKVDVEALSAPVDKLKKFDVAEELEYVVSYMHKNQLETLFELYSDIFSPSGFELEKASSFQTKAEHEVWMSGSVLMVSNYTLKKIIHEIEG